MVYDFLTTRREDGVEYLTLNRPDVRNAFNDQMVAELANWASAVSESGGRHEVRAAVLAGAGPVFCAGGDAKWMSGTIHYTEAENLRDARAMAEMLVALDTLPVPLICRIQGAAIGGGAGLAAVSDIVIAEARATFGFPEVKLGIVPGIIGPFVLAKIGQAAARELFVTGARFPASRAKDIGLVHAVVEAHELDTKVAEYVREILTNAPGAVAAAKAIIRDVRGRPTADAAAAAASVIAKLRVSAEGQEGLKAFLEKRKPRWLP
ncbi:MAG TPA: enoyl-CoA hydratase-related protein [Vicinamibacterales bacterium]|jgi:methylglutaconyl-CoA hydratase